MNPTNLFRQFLCDQKDHQGISYDTEFESAEYIYSLAAF